MKQIHVISSTKMLILILSLGALMVSAGCTQKVIDRKIYAVRTPRGTNWYYVTISATADSGEAEYKAGLYPAWAVNAYLGNDSEIPEGMDREGKMRDELHKAMLAAFKDYIDAVQTGGDADINKARKKLLALQSIPIANAENMPDPEKSQQVVQYNLIENMVDDTAGKKYVIALSNDPDAILQSIAAIAEEPETSAAITGSVLGIVSLTNSADIVRASKDREAVKKIVENLRILSLPETIEEIESIEDLQVHLSTIDALTEVMP